jgi:three-Cys-motif partner protein
MAKKEFFAEQLPGSKVKSNIVSQYFTKWSKVIIGQVKKTNGDLGYLDFFCGPGKYEDGSDSTPLMILKQAIDDTYLRDHLVTLFNDQLPGNIQRLEQAITEIPETSTLKHQPIVLNETVGGEIVKIMKEINLLPSLVFVDPWGYKGLSLELIGSVIKDWGCDCIFFFNYNRINAAITNPFMRNLVNGLFGEGRAVMLRQSVKHLDAEKREKLVLQTFIEALKEIRGDHTWRFKFYQEEIDKTSHFIIFVSKHPLGYSLMKETMAANCERDFGVPIYEFKPGRSALPPPIRIDLFGKASRQNPLEALKEDLLAGFSGRKATVQEIFFEHHLEKPYILANYKTALLELEAAGKISTEPKNRIMRNGKLTMADAVKITFN